MTKRIEEIYESTVVERDEHRKSKQYKRLSPKMKDAVDDLFKKMDAKPSDFLNSFERTITDVSKKYKVPERELLGYFEKEMLSDLGDNNGFCNKNTKRYSSNCCWRRVVQSQSWLISKMTQLQITLS